MRPGRASYEVARLIRAKPEWAEISEGHFVLGNQAELAGYRAMLGNKLIPGP